MKKVVTVILLLFIVVVITGLIPFTKQVAITVDAPYFNSYQQLTNPNNWRNWQPAIKSAFSQGPSLSTLNQAIRGARLTFQGGYFLIKQQGSNNLMIKKLQGGHDFNYSYTIIPESAGLTTTIVVTFKTNGIKYLIPAFGEDDLEKTSINDFKGFMENAKLYYGFDIRPGFASEKKIVVKNKIVTAENAYASGAEMQKEVEDYILLKHLTKAGPVMVQYITKPGGLLQMMVGIPVNEAVADGNGFLYMYMPATKVLTASFNGSYKDRKKIYIALEKYIQDKFLHVKISPYEVFANKFPTGDNEAVDFQLNCPIF
jgi:effector-binding domain-containing protein